jgi:nuclear transport factor 2 (NTF2) superfamily protein
VDEGTFKTWLEAYGHAWETRDPDAAAGLFTQDATYHETPFDEPMRGHQEILEYWSEVPRSQEDIRFSHEILALTEDEGIARWRANFRRVPSKTQVKLDGIFVVKLNGDGLCEEFREWWHKQE